MSGTWKTDWNTAFPQEALDIITKQHGFFPSRKNDEVSASVDYCKIQKPRVQK